MKVILNLTKKQYESLESLLKTRKKFKKDLDDAYLRGIQGNISCPELLNTIQDGITAINHPIMNVLTPALEKSINLKKEE
jgi:hypothetical protein